MSHRVILRIVNNNARNIPQMSGAQYLFSEGPLMGNTTVSKMTIRPTRMK